MYSDRTGTDKSHPGQNLPDKRPPDKPPGQKSPRTIETEFVQGGFCPGFCTRPSKIGGFPRCVTYFRGVPGCVTKCGRGERSKNWPKIAWRTLWMAPIVARLPYDEVIFRQSVWFSRHCS